MPKLDAIILASGLSRRMGCNKLLLSLGDSTIIGQFLSLFPYELFNKVIVVYGDPEVAAVAREYPVLLCHNHQPAAGKSHSIELGVLCSTADDGMMFAVADQPLLTGGTIRKLTERFYQEHCEKIIVPTVANRSANPVLFPADCRNELIALQGESGGRQLITHQPERVCYVSFGSGEEFSDVDTPEKYQKVVARWLKRAKSSNRDKLR